MAGGRGTEKFCNAQRPEQQTVRFLLPGLVVQETEPLAAFHLDVFFVTLTTTTRTQRNKRSAAKSSSHKVLKT